jgi:hypothetical protein
VDEQGNAWRIGESYAYASQISADRPRRTQFELNEGDFSLTDFRNKHRPETVEEGSPGTFLRGQGDYDCEQAVFPTASTFVIQGMMPGHTMIGLSPNKERQTVAKILYQGRDILAAGIDTKPGEEIKDVTIVVATSAPPTPAEKKPAAAKGADAGGAAKARPSPSRSWAAAAPAEGDDDLSPLERMERKAANVPAGETIHLVRSNHTWIGNDGEPLVYDDYDKQFYMSWGAHIVVLAKPAEGFRDFYGARTLHPRTTRMDVSDAAPEPLANVVLPGAIDLPAYQLLWQPSVQQALHLTPRQRSRLQEISAKYWPARKQLAGKELAQTESATHKELAECAAKAHGGLVRSSTFGDKLPFSPELIAKLERQWRDSRKDIEAVFTPDQLRTLKDLTFRTFAFGSGVMFEPEVLQTLGATQKQQDQLRILERQLRAEKNHRLRAMTREKAQKMLAVLTPQQRAQLHAQFAPDKTPEQDCSSYPYPALPSFMPDSGAAEELGFTAAQRERVRAIVSEHWMSYGRFQSQEQKLRVDDAKGFQAIGEKRRQEMQDLRKQIEGVLTPQQWASCKEIAFENQAVAMLPTVLTEQQQAALRAIEAEYFDKPQQIYGEMTDKALAAFTPAQQEKLRAEVARRGW